MRIKSELTRSPHWRSILQWFDSYADDTRATPPSKRNVDWVRAIPFILIHFSPLMVLFVGWSNVAIVTALFLFAIRMFAITAFYHRYFSHKAFQTSRFMQFIFAAIGSSAIQRGPLWWASHHRQHHARSDKKQDEHSPQQHGFLWSHMGWFLAPHNFRTNLNHVKDFAKYPELRFVDRFDILIPLLVAMMIYFIGNWLNVHHPEFNTNGLQMLIWYAISTLVLYHVTFTINSLAHRYGTRRYNTADDSRNNFALAVLTFGEGWHNNHHHYPGSAKQGFYWWEIDITYYGLKIMQSLGLIWSLRPVPQRVLNQAVETHSTMRS